MHQFEVVLALLVAIVALGLVAQRLELPAPALFVLGGLGIALVPGLPQVAFEPHLIFTIFVPPLLYRASLLASWRDLHANYRPIMLLSVGLVVFTTVVVGVSPAGTRLSLDPTLFLQQRVLTGSSFGAGHQRTDVPMLIDMFMDGKYKLRELISRSVGLEEVNHAYDLLLQGEVKRSVAVYS